MISFFKHMVVSFKAVEELTLVKTILELIDLVHIWEIETPRVEAIDVKSRTENPIEVLVETSFGSYVFVVLKVVIQLAGADLVIVSLVVYQFKFDIVNIAGGQFILNPAP
jgi:hypothetical protein